MTAVKKESGKEVKKERDSVLIRMESDLKKKFSDTAPPSYPFQALVLKSMDVWLSLPRELQKTLIFTDDDPGEVIADFFAADGDD